MSTPCHRHNINPALPSRPTRPPPRTRPCPASPSNTAPSRPTDPKNLFVQVPPSLCLQPSPSFPPFPSSPPATPTASAPRPSTTPSVAPSFSPRLLFFLSRRITTTSHSRAPPARVARTAASAVPLQSSKPISGTDSSSFNA